MRITLPVSVLLSVAVLGGAQAQAATVRYPTLGTPAALALSGDALVVVPTQLSGGTLAPVRVVPGQPPQAIPVADAKIPGGREDEVSGTTLRASAAALAVGASIGYDLGYRTYVGPSTGPLRRVASCPGDGGGLPVAVDGTRIAWIEGGCEDRTRDTFGPATVVVGDADPAVPVRRYPLPAKADPLGLSLGAGGDLVLYAADGDRDALTLAPLAPQGLGAPLALGSSSAGYALLGRGADGTTYLADDTRYGGATGCDLGVRRIAPGATALGAFPAAGCLAGDDVGGGGAILAGDSVVTIANARDSRETAPRAALLRTPLAGGTAATLLTLRGRRPLTLTADAARVAYAVEPCGPGEAQETQLVVTDAPEPPLAECSVRITGATLKLTGKVGRLAVTCPIGCRLESTVTTKGRPYGEYDSVARGAARIDVELPKKRPRVGSVVTVRVAATDGPTVTKRVRVVR